jgi:hypothetical protein
MRDTQVGSWPQANVTDARRRYGSRANSQAHFSSKLAATGSAVDTAACGGAATVGTSMAMCPSRKGFGEGWARMGLGLRKARVASISQARSPSLDLKATLPLLRLLRVVYREERIDPSP